MSLSGFSYFAIFAAMRTGSNLLERSLAQYEGLTCHGELFNPSFIGKEGQGEYLGIDLETREKDPSALLRSLASGTSDTLPGFRIFQGHDDRVVRACLSDPDCGKIILRRTPIESFISLQIARATDQWILGGAPKRKSAQVTYDGAAYRDYLSRQNAFHDMLRLGLQESGQTAFEIAYEDLKTPSILNGLVRYLGLDEQRSSFEEPIKRQNPEPLAQKVTNYDEMVEDLARLGGGEAGGAPATPMDRNLGVRDLVASRKTPVLFAPLPGVRPDLALALIARLDGDGSDPPLRDLNQKELGTWQEAAPGLECFALVAHPLQRAYDVFMENIFPASGASYPKIRRRLAAHYAVELPDDEEDWDAARHAGSFEAFLMFLKVNLNGQTGIRIDGKWEMQHRLLAAMSAAQPVTRVLRSDMFDAFARALAAEHGASWGGAQTRETHAIGLKDIYSRRLENLARAAYAKDYRMFGFSDWAPEAGAQAR